MCLYEQMHVHSYLNDADKDARSTAMNVLDMIHTHHTHHINTGVPPYYPGYVPGSTGPVNESQLPLRQRPRMIVTADMPPAGVFAFVCVCCACVKGLCMPACE